MSHLLALAAETVTDPGVQRALWEWLLMLAGGIVTVAGAGAVVWRVAVRPHFVEAVRKITETHKSVTVNGGRNSPPTLRDEVGSVQAAVDHLARAVAANADRTNDLAGKVDLLSELTQDTRDDLRAAKGQLEEHVASGEQYLGKVRVVLTRHGIDLPES